MKNTKRLLAIVLSFLMIAMSCITTFAETPNADEVFNLTSAMSYTDNGDGSYTLTKGETTAVDTNTSAFLQPIDLKTQGFKFKFSSPNSTYGQGIFVLTNAPSGLTGVTDTSNGAVAFLLVSNGDTWRLDAYNGTVSSTWLATPTKADVHEFGISKSGSNYWLAIDGVNKVDLTTKVPAIEALYNSGEAYVNFGVAGSGKACTFSQIQVVERTGFNTAPNTTVTKNDDGSYNLSVSNGKTNLTSSVLYQPINLKTQGFKFKFTGNDSSSYERGFFTLTGSPEGIKAVADGNYGVSLQVIASGTDFRVSLNVDGTEKVAWAALITQADVHEFGISKSGSNYWLTVDGVNKVNLTSNSADTLIKEIYESGMAYLNLGVTGSDVACTFSQIQVVNLVGGINTPTGVTVTGNETDGYTLAASGSYNPKVSTVLNTPIDINNKAVQFKATPSTGGPVVFAFTNTTETLNDLTWQGTDESFENASAVLLRITSAGQVWVWYNTGGGSVVTTIDISVPHVYNVVKDKAGNWWLNIDGNEVANLSEKDTSGTIASRLDALAASGKTYLHFGSQSATFTVSGIKVCDMPNFSKTSSITEGGDAANGYTLNNVAENTSALLKTPINLKKQQIEFKANYVGNGRLVIIFQGNKTRSSKSRYDASELDANNMFVLHLKNIWGGQFVVCGSESTDISYGDPSFGDYSAVHTVGFAKLGNNWWLTMNGVDRVNLTEKHADAAARIEKLVDSGEAYVCFTVGDPSYVNPVYNISNIKISNNPIFSKDSSITEGGDETNGYTASGIVPGTSALFKTPIDIKTQQIEFNSNFCPETRLALIFQDNATKGTAPFPTTDVLDENNMYVLHLSNAWNTSFLLYGANGGSSNASPSYGKSYAKENTIKIGFNKSGGKWWLTVNGDNKVDISDKEPDAVTRLDALAESGMAYFYFTAYTGDPTNKPASFNISNLKISDIPEFFKDSSITEGGDATNGYTLNNVAENTSALLRTPIDIKTQQIQFQANYQGSGYLSIIFQGNATRSSKARYDASEMDANNMFVLLVQSLWTNNFLAFGSEAGSGNITDYGTPAFGENAEEKIHTVGFAKSGGKWWLTINGVNKVNLTETHATAAARIENLAKSGEAYVAFSSYETGSNNPVYNISNLKIIERTGYNLYPTMTVTENEDGSYNIIKNKTDAVDTNTSVVYEPIDLKTQALKFEFTSDSPYAKSVVSFTNAPCGLTGPQDTQYGSVSFRLQGESEWAIIVYKDGEPVTKGVVAPRISKDAHTFGISYVYDNWWLTVDGINTLNFNNDIPEVIPAIQELYDSGKAYLQFSVVDSSLRSVFNGIKTVNYKSGDPNVDNTFDIRDMLALNKKLKTYYKDIRIDDFDNNGTVNANDLVAIRNKLLSEFTVYAEDFGAIINDGNDDAEAIRKAIKAVSEMGNGAALVLENGVYNIDTPVENTEFAFYFTGLKDVTILGNDTTFMLGNPKFFGFYFTDSDSVTIKGISIDYAIKPWIQGTVKDVDSSNNTFVIATGNTGTTVFDYENWNSGTLALGIMRDPDDQTIHHSNRNDYFEGVSSVERVPDTNGDYRVTLSENTHITSGHIANDKHIVFLNRINTGGAFRFLRIDGDITVENCNIYASSAAGFLAGYVDGDVKFIDSKIIPNDGNWIATNADGFYMHNIKGRFILSGSHIQGVTDDMINLHNTGIMIFNDSDTSDNIITGNYYHIPEVGDKIDIIDPTTGNAKYKDVTVTAVSATYVPSHYTNSLKLTLDQDVEVANDKNGTRHGYVAIYQKAQAPGTVISNNTFCNNGRGAGPKVNARELKIINNEFKNITGPVITLFDLPSHVEYGGGDNITISGNTITDCAFGTTNANGVAREKWSAIAVGARQSTGVDTEATGFMFNNVKITNNIINGVYKNGIYVSNAKNVTISGNTINCDVNRGDYASDVYRSAIAINIVDENIFVKNNTVNYIDPPIISTFFKPFRAYAAYYDLVTANSSGNTYRGSSAEWSIYYD